MKWLSILMLSSILSPKVNSQNQWSVQKEKDGITVSTRKSATSPFNDVWVQADLPGTTDQLAAILLDVDKYTEWAYATKKASVYKRYSASKLIYYSEIDVPWPATDRFFYAMIELKKNAADNSIDLVSTSLPPDYGPAPADLVRVPYSKGTWHAKRNPGNSVHVDYFLELNPGKSLPSWVLNLFSTKGPLETFEKVKEKMSALNR